MIELNPTIKEVATYYNFDIKWCDILNHWVITSKPSSYAYSFFWRSDSTNPIPDFFDELKSYFEDIGVENEYWN